MRLAQLALALLAALWFVPDVLAAGTSIFAPFIQDSSSVWGRPTFVRITDLDQGRDSEDQFALSVQDEGVEAAQFQSRILPLPTIVTQVGRSRRPSLITSAERRVGFSSLGLGIGVASYVQSREGKSRQSTDIGNLLGKSPAALGVRAVRRQPIVTKTQVRGKKSVQSLASNSYWIPARMDLDTAMSKIDSGVLEDVIVIRGPYSSIYGPAFDFADFNLRSAPRYEGLQWHGATSVSYKTNGEQWYGRQTIDGGDEDSGFWFSYGHRAGNDYLSGDGNEIPSSYNSRDTELVYSFNPTSESELEFSVLRLDQTDVEMPGQAFDINFLKTDAYEFRFANSNVWFADRFEVEAWYNRTVLLGDAQRASKRRQFPIYDDIDFEGETDVDSLSTGHSAAWTWENGSSTFTMGTDLRYVKQELNEITSGDLFFRAWDMRNSPIPRSHQSNPGLFVQRTYDLTTDITLTSGARVDWVSTNIDDDPDKLLDVGARDVVENPLTLGEILGSDNFDQDFTLASSFLLSEVKLTSCWTGALAFGYAERAPTLTELYAAETFMFLLQNGLNTVTGDPELDKERLWQIDVGITYDDGRLRTGLFGFHSWIRDYVTFENLDVFGVLGGPVEQVNLKFVNTQLATLAGGEFFLEYDSSPWLTPFATVSYVEGRDHSRNGEFATRQSEFNAVIPSTPSERVAGADRGEFSGVPGTPEEPLPSISPLEARLGIRLHEQSSEPNWSVELSARIVDNQDRVATSLLESTTPGFTVWDIRGYWKASDRILMLAGVENFTDKQYREYLDFRPQNVGGLTVFQPGVNFYFGSEVSF